MKEIILAIDIGHNVSYDIGAVGIRREDDLNRLVGNALKVSLGRGVLRLLIVHLILLKALMIHYIKE